MTFIEEMACDSNLDAAYEWLCHRRKDYPDDADVWSLRFNWPDEKARIQHDLLTECYQFEPLSVVANQAGETLHIWSAREQLAKRVKERFILNLLWQYMHRVSTHGGLFREHQIGIPRGCALSPLIGAFFLDCLDRQMQGLGIFYVRFMDDFIVLASTRWKLRRAIKVVNQFLHGLKLVGWIFSPPRKFLESCRGLVE